MANSPTFGMPGFHTSDEPFGEVMENPETGSPFDFGGAMPPDMPATSVYGTGEGYPAQCPQYRSTQFPQYRFSQPPSSATAVPSYYHTNFPPRPESTRSPAFVVTQASNIPSFYTNAEFQQRPLPQFAASQHLASPGHTYQTFLDHPAFNGGQQSLRQRSLPLIYTSPKPANTLAQPPSGNQEHEVKSKGATPQRPQKISTERKLTPTTKAGYDSVLWRHLNVVQRWRSWGYNSREIQLILQYFEQVSQIKGQDRVDKILQMRAPDIIRLKEWARLDSLDPLRRCPPAEGQRPGVPQVGSILGRMVNDTDDSVQGDRPPIDDNEPNPEMTKGEKNYQLRGYRKHWQCLPIGTTCFKILREYPNHMSYEFLDAFLQHRVMASVMMDHIPQNIRDAFRAQNVYQSDQHGNILTKRLNKRMKVLIEKAEYDYARVDQYLGSHIKLRELGFESGPVDQKTSSVWNHQQNIDEGWRRWWATDKGKKELKQQGLEGQQPLPPNIPTKRSSDSQKSTASESLKSLPSSDVPTPTTSRLGKSARGTKTPAAISGPSPAITPSSTVAAPAAHRSPPGVSAEPNVRPWNGKIEFSASITDDSLGKFQAGPFWASEQEYLQHIEKIISLNGKCKKLLTWIVEHDPAAKGSSGTQEDSVSQALLYLIGAETEEKYKQFGRHGHVPPSGVMKANTIVTHLEGEIAMLLRGRVNAHGSAGLKEKAQYRQVALHKAIAQSLATIVSIVLSSVRHSIFYAATDRDRLHRARLLVSTTEEAMNAQRLHNATMKQKFFYADELKTAMAVDIQEKAEERLDNEFVVEDVPTPKKKGKKQGKVKESDAEFLQIMLEETRYQKAHMIDTQLRVFPDDPLNAALQAEAECNCDEIVEQILAELEELNKPKVSPKPTEQPAPEDGQSSNVSGAVQQTDPAKESQSSANTPAVINDQSNKADKTSGKRGRNEADFGDNSERRPTKKLATDVDVAAIKGMAPPRDFAAVPVQQQNNAPPPSPKRNSRYNDFLDAQDAEKRRAKEERNRLKAVRTQIQTEENRPSPQGRKQKAVTFDLPPNALMDESSPVAPAKRLSQKATAEDEIVAETSPEKLNGNEISESIQAMPEAPNSIPTISEAFSSGAADASGILSSTPNPKKRSRDERDDVDAEGAQRSMQSSRQDNPVLDSTLLSANQEVDVNGWVAMMPGLDALMPQMNNFDASMPLVPQMADFEIDSFDSTLPFDATLPFESSLPIDVSSFDDAQTEVSAWATQAYGSGSGADDWTFADVDGASDGNGADAEYGTFEEEFEKIIGGVTGT